MTAFSLFHKPTFKDKLCSISSKVQRRALLASMFAYSAKFKGPVSERESPLYDLPPSDSFSVIANCAIEEALRECSDDSPPLCLLQAMILTTFHELIKGVQGRSWRSVGACVRIAYDLRLHMIDKNSAVRFGQPKYGDEERRRAWWAIWELDVFASTIQRLPTAIDWKHNMTWLPIDDQAWYQNSFTASCTLSHDPVVAWKLLERSDNKSPKAWFILLNALMRCAHLLSYPQFYSHIQPGSEQPLAPDQSIQARLDVLSSSLYCLTAVLPPSIEYRGEFLSFTTAGTKASVKIDSDKHSVHLMIQLCRFMIYRHQVIETAPSHLGLSALISTDSTTSKMNSDTSAWSSYLSAASEITRIIRNCSPEHVSFVNPFLASTIWLAAAAQLLFQRSEPLIIDRRTAESNLDLLKINLNAYNSIWGVLPSYKQKLETMETKLSGLKSQNTGSRAGVQTTANAAHSQPPAESQEFQYARATWPPQYNIHLGTMTGSTGPQRAGWNLGGWAAPGGFTDTDANTTRDTCIDLSRCGIDELLTYGINEGEG